MRTKLSSPADSPKVADIENDYETKGHLNTLLDAHGILSDDTKMKKVHALAGRHSKAIKSLSAIQAVAAPDSDDKKPITSVKELKAIAQKKLKA